MAKFGRIVLKLGGSVLTAKNDYCTPNLASVRAFGRAIAELWPDLRGRLILVIGGGSFGNAIPSRYGIADPDTDFRPQHLFRMTEGMFKWCCTVVEVMSECGIAAYPFQTGTFVALGDDDRPRATSSMMIEVALNRGLLPVLTGDLVVGGPRSSWFRIVSSDTVPEILASCFSIQRAVMMSDVEGLLDRQDGGAVIRRVDAAAHDTALAAAGPSRSQDLTGGMRTKVEAMLALAHRGVQGVICRADPHLLESALFSDTPPGTIFESCHGVEVR